MDNNLINIDDLVRQRLGGAQEPERAGAWSRMEQLLDKEDRRKPFGLYWKRAMSYCGVAMFLAAVSVGGYEMTAAFRNNGDAAKGSYPAGISDNSGTAHSGDVVQDKNLASTASVKANGVVANHEKHIAATSKLAPVSGITVRAAKYAHTAATNENVASTEIVQSNASITKDNNKVSAAAIAAKNEYHSTNGSITHETSSVNKIATSGSINKNIDNHLNNVSSTAPVMLVSNKAGNVVKEEAGIAEATISGKAIVAVQPKNEHKIDNGHGSVYVSAVNGSSAKGNSNTQVPVKQVVVVNSSSKTGGAIAGNLVAPVKTGTSSFVTAPGKPITGKKIIERITMREVSAGRRSGNVNMHLDTISIDMITLDLPGHAAAEDQSGAIGNTANRTHNAANAGNTANKKSNIIGKNATGTASVTASKSTAKQSNTSATSSNTLNSVTNNSGAHIASNGNEESAADQQDVAAITPNAALAAAPNIPTATTPAEKAPTVVKKKHGSNMAERLSSMFNEVKYKISGVQFAPGLTAGINGTFFGPNSFKGFQFGFAGAFELDDNWSLMAEVKYFNRMNNNYTMYDNYNKYQATAGGFYKDSTERTYSFSTLHSFEMPVSIRYTAARFSFFAGGNFVYSLGVNTGAAERMIDPSTRPIVASATSNAAPSLTDADFGSRFGIGYLCGLSFRATPNVTFDFRETQTVWDNMKATGSQTVSGQLYKSPSLQFSLIYRLGGGNKESKD